ncbi:uncharacterized protein LOC106459056 [Limulus polyphemus]|uniref:Uncharacterized protein LOC106459056 n=1 Tax=Limulus polyphemus TaxID=6850 RepID=A0ABM1B3J5_LIMPO|nr:uncharacterized protein LOC106459056 [Limulus polyphemus]
MDSINRKTAPNLLTLSNEIINKLLLFCSVNDISSLSQTCKRLRECTQSEYLWYHKWVELVDSCGLKILAEKIPVFETSEVYGEKQNGRSIITYSYFKQCQRLWKVCYRHGKGLQSLPTCSHCGKKTCSVECLSLQEHKMSLDIGSKVTWLLTTKFSIERHSSVLMSSKVKSYFSHFNSVVADRQCVRYQIRSDFCCFICDQADKGQKYGHSSSRVDYSNKVDTSVCECFMSEPSDLSYKEKYSCENLFVGSKKTQNHDLVAASKTMVPTSLWSDLPSLLKDTYPDCDIQSPLECFLNGENFCYLEQYLHHILQRYVMLDEAKKPSVSFVFCEPYNTTTDIRRKIARYLFEEHQVARICFLNKALSAAYLVDLDTCLVIDSGASNTVVTLIIDGKVQVERTRSSPVGGLAIAHFCAEAIKLKGLMDNVSIPSLDNSRVKSFCYLSYNIAVEERKKTPRRSGIFVRPKSQASSDIAKLEKVELGAELYLAPEVMYSAMRVPELVQEVLQGLEPSLVQEILSQILLTGCNTELNGFTTRLIRDLQTVLPEYSRAINIHSSSGCQSWDAVMGSSRVSVPLPPSRMSSDQVPGSLVWVTREQYILYGDNSLH